MRLVLPIALLACTGTTATPRAGTQIGQEGDLLPCERIVEPLADLDEAPEGLAYTAVSVMALATHTAAGTFDTPDGPVSLTLELEATDAYHWFEVMPEQSGEPPTPYCFAQGYLIDATLVFGTGGQWDFEEDLRITVDRPDALRAGTPLVTPEELEPPNGVAQARWAGLLAEGAWEGNVTWFANDTATANALELVGGWRAVVD